MDNPELWSVENPYLYRAVTEVMSGGKVADRYEITTGIRSFAFNSAKGFFLNGKPLKILGVCNHHDLGCLGAAVNTDLTCSAYDNCSAPWGSTHEHAWQLTKKYDYLSGMYIWTGFDYLGEPTPYWWPARSSYFGIIDLAGFPKDAFYMYQSEWTEKPVLHIFPHWTWTPGQVVDVWAYTNCDEVELLINGNSLGRQKRTDEKLHLVWRITYEPGTITGVGYKDGVETMREEVKTAGDPAAIILTPDRSEINADGSDLSFLTVTVVDKDGVPVPRADNLIKFSVDGKGTIAGVDNSCQTSMEPFKADYRKAFNGKCLLVVKAGAEAGNISVKASSDGLTDATTAIRVR